MSCDYLRPTGEAGVVAEACEGITESSVAPLYPIDGTARCFDVPGEFPMGGSDSSFLNLNALFSISLKLMSF